MKGVGRVYQQTFVDTYAKVGFVKLYDRKTPITAANLLNDRVIPFYEEHGIPLQRVLTDRGTEYCGNPERHEYELHLAVEDIDHTRTKAKSPQTTDMIDKSLFCEFGLSSPCARVTAWRRAGREARALLRTLYRRASVAAPVRTLDAARVDLLLTDPRLSGVKLVWSALAATADKEGWPAARFLAALVAQEVADRGQRRFARHLSEAPLPPGKTLDAFDFDAVPMISGAQVQALAAGDAWLEKGAMVFWLTPWRLASALKLS